MEEDMRLDDMIDLRKAAFAALLEAERVERLGPIELGPCQQRIARRLMAEIEDEAQIARAADLALREMAER